MNEDEIVFRISTRKTFNVTGPCFPSRHYMLPAIGRLPDVVRLINEQCYFVIHAARQSGKTTALKFLTEKVNASGALRALYCSLEAVEQMTDPDPTLRSIAALILQSATLSGLIHLDDAQIDAVLASGSVAYVVSKALRLVSEQSDLPLVVFFDEADCLPMTALVSFLRQLRDGYINRTSVPFPSSVALVGLRNIQDYRAQVRTDSETLGTASPFNVISDALTLRNFTEEEVRALYAQHTTATGQTFDEDVFAEVMHWTGGQPWLVNAIARECVEKIHQLRYAEPVTADDVRTAKETIIRRRDTHILSLMGKLDEERVRRVVEPVMTGRDSVLAFDSPDCQYVLDLGILKIEKGTLVPANQMYAEMIVRHLSYNLQSGMQRAFPEVPWITADGLDMNWLVRDFQRFWRENAGAWKEWYRYREAGPHLMFMAFLQRVVNGGGVLTREMALGSCRMDIGLLFRGRKYGVEIKLRETYRREAALAQVAKYLALLDAPEGWLLVFETAESTWEDVSVEGRVVHIVGCL